MEELERLFAWCREVLGREETRVAFDGARRREAGLRATASPWDVIELLGRQVAAPSTIGTLPESLFGQRDRALLAVLAELQRGPGERWPRALLLLTFAPTLRLLHRRHGALGESDERAQQVVVALLEVAHAYPRARRPAKVAANIARDVEHAMWMLAMRRRRFLRIEERLRATAPAATPVEAGLDTERPAAALARIFGAASGSAEEILARLVEARVLTDVERHLLLAAHVEGRSLKSWVASGPPELGGLGYEAAKKRTQRAVVRLRDHIARPRRRCPGAPGVRDAS